MSTTQITLSDAFESYTQSYRELWEGGEFDCLDIETWMNTINPELIKVEFLLTYGGPTVRVEIDEHDRVTFSHSWAVNSIGEPMTENVWTSGDDAEFWIMLADEQRSYIG